MPASEGLKAAAFEAGSDPALIIGADGALKAANEAAESLFGQGLGLLIRSRFRDIAGAGDKVDRLMARAIETGSPARERDVEFALPGQHAFQAAIVAAPLVDGAVLLTLHPSGAHIARRTVDVHGLRSIGGLGRMLAHEIKNPLAGIRGAAQLLKSGVKAEDAALAELIVEETERIRRLVDRVEELGWDHPVAGHPVNIHAVLDRVKALAANGPADGLVLRDAYDPSLPPTNGDEDQLIQIFLNLVKNAAEAAHARGDGRGEIVITTAYRHGLRVRTEDGQTKAVPLEVKIVDNGPGVPARLRDQLFEPFVSSKSNGTGLGLALVAKLVAAHGGLVDFESEPGRTQFRVLLPVQSERAAG
jgi:two-component system nitrogen regulation sensor histidine kinase GlnL